MFGGCIGYDNKSNNLKSRSIIWDAPLSKTIGSAYIFIVWGKTLLDLHAMARMPRVADADKEGQGFNPRCEVYE